MKLVIRLDAVSTSALRKPEFYKNKLKKLTEIRKLTLEHLKQSTERQQGKSLKTQIVEKAGPMPAKVVKPRAKAKPDIEAVKKQIRDAAQQLADAKKSGDESLVKKMRAKLVPLRTKFEGLFAHRPH